MRRSAIAAAALSAGVAILLAASPPSVGFRLPLHVPGGTRSAICAVFDANGDGFRDIVLAPGNDLTLRIVPGRGDGTFGSIYAIPAGRRFSSSLLHDDLNGDGVDDIVTSASNTKGIEIFLTNGAGGHSWTFSPWTSATTIGWEFPALVDFDGDGDLDILTNGTSTVYGLRLNDGTGHFGTAAVAPLQHAEPSSDGAVIAADFDGDGDDDLLVRGGTKLFLHWREDDGKFSGPESLVFTNQSVLFTMVLTAADFDGDGLTDIAGVGGSSSLEDRLFVLRHTSARTFDLGTRFPHVSASNLGQIAAADLNGDGRPEIVTPQSLHVNGGDGTFAKSRRLPAAGGNSAAAGDLDGDGVPDVATSARSGSTSGDAAVVMFVGEPGTHPWINSADPAAAFRGTEADVVMNGVEFDLLAQVTADEGLTISDVTVVGPNLVLAHVAVSAQASHGAHEIRIENLDGAVATTAFTVLQGGHAFVGDVAPDRAHAGETLAVALTGSGFREPVAATLGEGVFVDTVVLESGSVVWLTVTVLVDAPPGPRTLTVTNGSGLVSQRVNAFTVLPPRSINLTQFRGRARVSPEALRSSISVEGFITFNQQERNAAFDPALQVIEIRIGDAAEPLVLEILPDSGWKVRGRRAKWRTPRGGGLPRMQFSVDFVRGRYRLDVERANLGLPASGDISVEFLIGGDSGSAVRHWTPVRDGFLLR